MAVCRLLSVAVLTTTALMVMGLLPPQYDDNTKKYIKYQPGTLDVIITAPHGGSKKPSSIPNRIAGCYIGSSCVFEHGCGSPNSAECGVKLLKDSWTYTIAGLLADELESLTGDRPHIIYNQLHRSKLDANREVNEATLNVQEAIDAYNHFHAFVDVAKTTIGGRALVIDLHAQIHPTNWTELGYTIPRSKLNSGAFTASDSTIKHLGGLTCDSDDACFKDLIRGTSPNSLGYYLGAEGYRVVPSPEFPSPGTNAYYAGGYDLKTHGSRYIGIVDAIQIEMPGEERKVPGRRGPYAKALARAVNHFHDDHY